MHVRIGKKKVLVGCYGLGKRHVTDKAALRAFCMQKVAVTSLLLEKLGDHWKKNAKVMQFLEWGCEIWRDVLLENFAKLDRGIQVIDRAVDGMNILEDKFGDSETESEEENQENGEEGSGS